MFRATVLLCILAYAFCDYDKKLPYSANYYSPGNLFSRGGFGGGNIGFGNLRGGNLGFGNVGGLRIGAPSFGGVNFGGFGGQSFRSFFSNPGGAAASSAAASDGPFGGSAASSSAASSGLGGPLVVTLAILDFKASGSSVPVVA